MEGKRKNKGLLFLALIVLASLAAQLYEINEPWVGRKDLNGATYSIIARNYVLHGYIATRFGPAFNTGPVGDGEFTYYLHHPPLLPLIISGGFHLCGVHEWCARLVCVIFFILSILLFFLLVREVWGEKEALYSAPFLALSPMTLYFNRVVLHEPAITLGIILILRYYYRWRRRRRPSDYWKIVAIFAVYSMLDWPAYYILPLLPIHTLIVDRGKESPGRRRILSLPLFGILFFLLYQAYSYLLTSSQNGAGLLDSFILRSAVKTPFIQYSFPGFLHIEAIRGYHLFTPVVCLLSLCWFLFFLAGRWRDDPERESLVLLLLLFGAIHVFLFLDAAWIHEFWMYYLSPGLALSAGLAMAPISGHFHAGLGRVAGIFVPGLLLLFLVFSRPEAYSLHQEIGLRNEAIAGMRVHHMSGEREKVIVYWERPIPRIEGNYYRYYGSPIYNKPNPNFAYYADRNIRWGLDGRRDLLDLLEEPGDRYRFFLTRLEFLREAMEEGIRSLLLERFEPRFMLDARGNPVDRSTMLAILRGEEPWTRGGLIAFERKEPDLNPSPKKREEHR